MNQDPIKEALKAELNRFAWNESFADPDIREAAFSAALNKKLKSFNAQLGLKDGKLTVVMNNLPDTEAWGEHNGSYDKLEFDRLAQSVVEEHKFNVLREQKVVVSKPENAFQRIARENIERMDKELGLKP